jgi:hypothetical protein
MVKCEFYIKLPYIPSKAQRRLLVTGLMPPVLFILQKFYNKIVQSILIIGCNTFDITPKQSIIPILQITCKMSTILSCQSRAAKLQKPEVHNSWGGGGGALPAFFTPPDGRTAGDVQGERRKGRGGVGRRRPSSPPAAARVQGDRGREGEALGGGDLEGSGRGGRSVAEGGGLAAAGGWCHRRRRGRDGVLRRRDARELVSGSFQ